MRTAGKKLWYLFLAAVALAYCLVEASGEGDLLIFLTAAGELGNDSNIYLHTFYGGYNYYYSILFALLLKPFYTLPYYGVKFCWLLLNLGLFVHLFRLLAGSGFVKILEPGLRRLFLGGVFVFSFRFLHENIHASQITILILWCCINGLRYLQAGHPVRGSVLLAAGINIKLLPVVFLPYLLYRRYFRAFFMVVILYAAALFLPSVFIGHDYNMTLLKTWWVLINPSSETHVLDVAERSFHGLSTLLSTLLVEEVPDLYALPMKRNIMNISTEALFRVLLAARLLLIALTLKFLKWPPFTARAGSWQRVTEISYILLAVPLIFPHQQHYAFLFMVPAFACVWYHFLVNYRDLGKTRRNLLIAALAFIYLSANLRSLLGEFNYFYEHYKILSYGALLLIPLLVTAAAKPGKITDS